MTFFDTKIFITVNLFFCVVIFFFGEKIYSNLSSQVYIFLIPLIWPGLAHGSLDILTAKEKENNKKFVFFINFLNALLINPNIIFFFHGKFFLILFLLFF